MQEAHVGGHHPCQQHSPLPITKITKASSCPEKAVGMHHFSPVHKMQALKEISLEDKPQQLKNSKSNLKPLGERLAITKTNMKGLETNLADILKTRKKSQTQLESGQNEDMEHGQGSLVHIQRENKNKLGRLTPAQDTASVGKTKSNKDHHN